MPSALLPLLLSSLLASPTLSLTMPPPSHLVVVGGGIQGASVAYFASKLSPSTKITIVEANDGVAAHASGKGGGFLARSWGDGSSTEQLHHESFDLHEKLAEEWKLPSYRKLPVLSVQGSGSKPFRKFASKKVPIPNFLDGNGGGATSMGDGSDTAQVRRKRFRVLPPRVSPTSSFHVISLLSLFPSFPLSLSHSHPLLPSPLLRINKNVFFS